MNEVLRTISPVLETLKAILIDFPIHFCQNHPYQYYGPFYTIVIGSLITAILLKIPAIEDFTMKHSSKFYLTHKFDIGVAVHLIMCPSLKDFLAVALVMAPTTLFNGWLIENGYNMSQQKLGIIFVIYLITKWWFFRKDYSERTMDDCVDMYDVGSLLLAGLWAWTRMLGGWRWIVAVVATYGLVFGYLNNRWWEEEKIRDGKRMTVPVLISAVLGFILAA